MSVLQSGETGESAEVFICTRVLLGFFFCTLGAVDKDAHILWYLARMSRQDPCNNYVQYLPPVLDYTSALLMRRAYTNALIYSNC